MTLHTDVKKTPNSSTERTAESDAGAQDVSDVPELEDKQTRDLSQQIQHGVLNVDFYFTLEKCVP